MLGIKKDKEYERYKRTVIASEAVDNIINLEYRYIL